MSLNQSAPVAQEVSVSDGQASVRISLAFINPASMFSDNGNFLVGVPVMIIGFVAAWRERHYKEQAR